jgi:hypothetical protein
MDRTGDTRVMWDPNNGDEVTSARNQFNELRGKGYLAYKVTETAGKGDLIREFDPDAGKIILAPPMRGG